MNLRTLVSAGMLVTAGMLASRVLGFLREAMIATHYGTGADANMVIGLLLIPDYITSLLIGGALSAVLLPAFATRNDIERLALFWQVMVLSVILFTVLALLVYSQADAIIASLHGEPDKVPHEAVFWALFSMPLAGIGGVITAWLQYHSRFAIPAFANALFNLVIVLTLWLAPTGFTVIGIGIFMAAFARMALYMNGFVRSTGRVVPGHYPWQVNRRLLLHYSTAVGNSFFSLLPQYIPYMIITLLSGQLAVFNYAFKLVMLPGMILNTVVNVVMLPRFVHLRKEGTDVPEYARSLRMGTALSFCISLAMCLASWNIVSLCFGYGKMTEDNIQAVADVFAIGVWALPGMVAGCLWQQIFFAREQPEVPFKVGLMQAVISVPMIWLAQSMMQEAGVMAACVILQVLPVIAFSIMAKQLGVITFSEQWKGSGVMLTAPLLLFLPMALLFRQMHFSASVGLVVALVIGCVTLMASYATDSEIRLWLQQRLRRVT